MQNSRVLLVFPLLIGLLGPRLAPAQTPAASPTASPAASEDVVYLHDGSVLHGQRLPLSAAAPDVVRLQLPSRDILTFALADVDSVRHQLRPPEPGAARPRGFGHYTELGALAARNTNSSVNTSAFSFQTVNGYRFRPGLFVGAGLGIDLYATQSLVPVFGSVRGEVPVRGGPLRPFWFVDGGYGFNLTGRDEALPGPVTYAGGRLWAAGLGLKVLFNAQTGFLVSVAYRAQNTAITRDPAPRQELDFQRLAVRAGFAF